jgi:excisionase family DNA binding protein
MEAIEIKEKAVYTFEEACKILKTSDTNLRRKLKGGAIKFSRLGRQYRFLGRDILEFLEGNREEKADTFFKWLDEINEKKGLPPITAEEAAHVIEKIRKEGIV